MKKKVKQYPFWNKAFNKDHFFYLQNGHQQNHLYAENIRQFDDDLCIIETWMHIINLQNQTPNKFPLSESRWVCTCSFCLEHSGWKTGPAETDGVEGQNSEGVVDVGRQFEVSCRLCSKHLGKIVPVAAVVKNVFILDQKFCVKTAKKN